MHTTELVRALCHWNAIVSSELEEYVTADSDCKFTDL